MSKRDMTILIPTHRRVDRQKTIREIPKEWLPKTRFVATYDEADKLQKRYPHIKVWRAPERIKSIAQKRAWMLRKCERLGIDKILMLDDDLRFVMRRLHRKLPNGHYEFNITKTNAAEVDWGLCKVAKMLDRYAHVGIGPRQGNNGIKHKWRWYRNTRMIYALGYHVPTIMKECEIGRIEHREDMDITLQLLTKGIPNVNLIEMLCDQLYGSPGGNRDERDPKASNADAELLASWFPKFVKVAHREYKYTLPRKEVTVSWKQAYAYGVEWRNRHHRRNVHDKTQRRSRRGEASA